MFLLSRIKKRVKQIKNEINRIVCCVCHTCSQHVHTSMPDVWTDQEQCGFFVLENFKYSFLLQKSSLWGLSSNTWADCNFDVPNAAVPARGTFVVTAMSRGTAVMRHRARQTRQQWRIWWDYVVVSWSVVAAEKNKLFFEKRLN